MTELTLPEFTETDHVERGDTAPAFTRPLVNDEYWSDASLSELTAADDAVVLVFYPMNGGGKSIYTWTEIQDRAWHEYATVVGVNIGTPFDHKRFLRDRGMTNYALFSDPTNQVAEMYGVVHELDGMIGVTEPRPAMFVIDNDRTVEYAWVASEWPENPPYDDVETAVEKLADRRS